MSVSNPMPRPQRGMLGARKRWGDPRHVKLAELSAPVRAAVLALIEADASAKAAAEPEPPGSGQG